MPVIVIAINANAMPGQTRKAAEVGFLDYLTKPTKVEKLMSAFKEATAEMSGARPEN